MKYLLPFIALTLLVTSCSKAPILDRATLFNPTSHDVKILFYKGGIVYPNDTVFLPANSQFLFAYGSAGRGAGIGRGFNSGYFGGSDDSIIVIFDNQYSITHYANTPIHFDKHYYLNSSLRNLGNPYSYDFAVVHENGDVINDHKYYFTEQDYQDAKD